MRGDRVPAAVLLTLIPACSGCSPGAYTGTSSSSPDQVCCPDGEWRSACCGEGLAGAPKVYIYDLDAPLQDLQVGKGSKSFSLDLAFGKPAEGRSYLRDTNQYSLTTRRLPATLRRVRPIRRNRQRRRPTARRPQSSAPPCFAG